MTGVAWTIVTGEYPPVPGGVSDYTRHVARALAGAGDGVRVWTIGADPGVVEELEGIAVHRVPRAFGRDALRRLESVVAGDPPPRRLLVQYVPHAFGWRAMNLPFARWVGGFGAAPVDVMFHEIAFPWSRRPSHALLAAVTRLMARAVGRGADRVFASTESWAPLLRRLGVKTPEVLAIPSNLPRANGARDAPAAGAPPRFGHFGTFGPGISALLEPAVASLLERVPGSRAVLVGRGSPEFAARFAERHPLLAPRLEPTGEVPPEVASERLARCDVLVQPYPDGATTRRTSLMAGLALGRAVVSNRGPLTEPLWERNGAIVLARGDPSSIAEHAAALLADPARREAVAAAGLRAHDRAFSIERTVERLRACLPRAAAS